MDLNKIELPAKVIADLYPDSLVATNAVPVAKSGDITAETEKTAPLPAQTSTASWKSLGNNAKFILVVVKNEELIFLHDNELTFLTGILGACKLTMEDVALVNMNNHPEASGKDLVHFFKSRSVLLFDIMPSAFGLPVNFPQYQLQPFAGTTYLYAPSLSQLENDRVEKSKLWVCLKRLFNL